jgi:nucleoid-associated protein YgaU
MARNEGKHRGTTSTGRKIARVALTGAVAAAPFAMTVQAASAAPQQTWDKVAQCEGSGNWKTNTGNGFQGGLQFTPSTWKAYGGTQFAPSANQASREQQIAVAERVLQAQGPNAWPVCSKKAGLTKGGGLDNQNVAQKAVSAVTGKKSEHKTEKPAAAKQETPHKGSYQVQKGDTLAEIGKKVGQDWHKIYDQNRDKLNNPNLVVTGDLLKID